MCWLLSCVASTLFSWTETNGSVAATARKKGATPFALALAMASRTTSVTHVTSRSRACRRNTPLPPSSTRSKGITKVVTKGPDLTPFWPPSPFTAFPTSEAEAKAAAKVEAAKSSSIPIKAAPGPLPGTSQAPTTRPGPRAHQSAITSPRQVPRRQSHWQHRPQFLPKLQHCQPREEVPKGGHRSRQERDLTPPPMPRPPTDYGPPQSGAAQVGYRAQPPPEKDKTYTKEELVQMLRAFNVLGSPAERE